MNSNLKKLSQWTLILAAAAAITQACGGSEEAPYEVAYRTAVDGGSSCGNDIMEFPEACDGIDLGAQTCASATLGKSPKGSLRCSINCTLVVADCSGSGPANGSGGSGGSGGSNGTGGGFGAGGRLR